jgi:antitoxin ParD1/3/4
VGQVKKVSVALTQELADMIKAAVNDGDYGSSSEVVRDALRRWQSDRTRRQAELGMLRREWRRGITSGPSEVADIEQIKRKARSGR